MRTIILLAAMLYAALTMAQVAPTTDVTLHMKPAKGGMVLSLNYDTHRILVSDSAIKRFKFVWGDGSEMKIDLTNQSKYKFNKLIKKMAMHDYTWLTIQGGFYTSPTRGHDRTYKYMH